MKTENDYYQECRLCGRLCGVDRTGDERGWCGFSNLLSISYAGLHFGEEPAITGSGGSGTVFCTGCSLQCFFCQNRQLHAPEAGREISTAEGVDILLTLQAKGAENINFVTGTHFIPSIVELLRESREQGLSIPVVWNSSGYETTQGLRPLWPWVDLFLPDLKTLRPKLAYQIFSASNYPETAVKAIGKMASNRPLTQEKTFPRRGTIVRHLLLPGHPGETIEVLNWFQAELRDKALLSLLFQYIPPLTGAGEGCLPARSVTHSEYNLVMEWLTDSSIDSGWVQEYEEGRKRNRKDIWRPDFTRQNPFPREYSVPVWHWRYGFVK